MGLSRSQGARTLQPDHDVDVQPRRARRDLRRPRQRRQQPVVLRDDRRDQPVWRATPAALRLLLPRVDQPDALRQRSVQRHRELRLGQVPRRDARVDPRARQRARRHAVAAARAGAGSRQQAPHRARLHRARQHADHAEPALRQRTGASHGLGHLAHDARLRLRGLGRERAGERRLPAVRRREVPGRAALRLAPDGQAEGRDPGARHPQLASAVDRADRHHLAGVRRQRLGRHRAHVLVDLRPQEAHARRHQAGIRGRGLRLPALQAHGRRRKRTAGVVRQRARDVARAITCR